MARQDAANEDRPLAGLADMLAQEKIRLPQVTLPERPVRPMSAAQERRLFMEAMADVTPLADGDQCSIVRPPLRDRPRKREDPDAEALGRLQRLVETGEGFDLACTAEYVEGSPQWMPPELFRRIHGGHFSIQDHVDLHGLDRFAARQALDAFMRRSIAAGRRAVLVVHGRGRCSPGPPVLKRKLVQWLTKGLWKRWVIAFTSARACDGGTGATVVLLRRRPVSGKRR